MADVDGSVQRTSEGTLPKTVSKGVMQVGVENGTSRPQGVSVAAAGIRSVTMVLAKTSYRTLDSSRAVSCSTATAGDMRCPASDQTVVAKADIQSLFHAIGFALQGVSLGALSAVSASFIELVFYFCVPVIGRATIGRRSAQAKGSLR